MRLAPSIITAALLAVPALLPASSAQADTMVEDIAFAGNTMNGPVSISGALFNPALGTLTGVSEVFTGSYAPDIVVSTSPAPTTAILAFSFSAAGSEHDGGTLGTYTLSQHGDILSGAAQTFAFAETAGSLAAYLDTASASANGFLAGVDLYSMPIRGGWGSYSDNSAFSGVLALTYSYTVPEPSSLVMLAFGLLLFAGLASRANPVSRSLARVQRRR